MKLLLKNATLIHEKSPFHNQKKDVLVVDGISPKLKMKSMKKVQKKLNSKIYISLQDGLIPVYHLENPVLNNVKPCPTD